MLAWIDHWYTVFYFYKWLSFIFQLLDLIETQEPACFSSVSFLAGHCCTTVLNSLDCHTCRVINSPMLSKHILSLSLSLSQSSRPVHYLSPRNTYVTLKIHSLCGLSNWTSANLPDCIALQSGKAGALTSDLDWNLSRDCLYGLQPVN